MKFDSIASICLYLIDRTKSSISLVMIKVMIGNRCLPFAMDRGRTNNGDDTNSMPDIGIPGHRNRDDTGIGSQSELPESRNLTYSILQKKENTNLF